MKSIMLFALFFIVISCRKYDENDIKNCWWLYGEGYHVGDMIDFKNPYWVLRNDTIYKNGNAVAILNKIERGFPGDDTEMEIISIETKQTGIYHEK